MKKAIRSEKAPQPVGPYSQAIECGGMIFVSGQIATDPATKKVMGDVKAQTRQVIENLKAVLSAAGSSLEKVVKTTVYMKDLAQFAAMNDAYAEYFKDTPPARATIEVARLPIDALVEIECIAEK